MKMKQTWLALLGAFLSVFMLGACTEESAPKESATSTEEITIDRDDIFTKDATGEAVSIDELPETIISLMPSNTEILYALDEGSRVIGVTEFDDYPEEVTKKEQVAGMEWNVEKIIDLQPDLVYAHEMSIPAADAAIQQLRDAGITVFVMPNAESFDETFRQIRTMAAHLRVDERGEQIINDMKETIDDVQAMKGDEPTRSVFVETSAAPDIYAPGNGTFIQEMLDIIGADNVVKEDGWVSYSTERVIEENPDVIIVMYDYVPNAVEELKERSGYETLTAVKEQRVYQVDENLLSRTGPRLAEGLRALAEAIYGESGEEEEALDDAA